jgi:5-methylcytosine-specific restriction endonuclease McrA
MNFKDLLLNLTEESRTKADSFRTTGEAMSKERAVSGAADQKAKDAARKRAERARQVPRSQKSKEELLKEIITVKTPSGSVQLIFKDSFSKSKHQKINRSDNLSFEEAKTVTKDPKFEQTGASKLLFGDIKKSVEKESSQSRKEKESESKKGIEKNKSEKPSSGKDEGAEENDRDLKTAQVQPQKQASKLSKKEVFELMQQMNGEQLAQVPFEVRQQYFMQTRNPTSNNAFDSLTFEKLSTMFGINTLTATPYNQQVINALVFLAKVKAGATEQELESYSALSPSAFDFTKIAFAQAKKILSQLGEQCIQTLVSNVETGSNPVASEGGVDMECGDYKFKISAGGEFLLTTDKFDQKSKTFRGLLAASIAQAVSDPNIQKDKKFQEFSKSLQGVGSQYSNMLLTKDKFEEINKNPELLQILKTSPMVDSTGKNLGMVVDEKGNLNKFASFENYKEAIGKKTTGLFKNTAKDKSQFVDSFVQNILKMYYRGDMIKDPKTAPTHLITQNGIFPMSDDFFAEVGKTSVISVKPTKQSISTDNIAKDKKYSDVLNRYSTVVEAKEEKITSIEDYFVPRSAINPVELALNQASQNMDFDINVSLIPGFSPKDINTVQYNYLKIGKKVVKIPVEKTEFIGLEFQENVALIANDILIEALTNNFVLSKLIASNLITDNEAYSITNPEVLNESADTIKLVYANLLERAQDNPKLLLYVLNAYNSSLYEKYVRDYKMEYRNYHGKPKQKKERAERTAAREELIRKGRVKKGSDMDVDHKNPLRNGGSNKLNNLRLRHKSKNRSDNGHKKGEKQDKDWK